MASKRKTINGKERSGKKIKNDHYDPVNMSISELKILLKHERHVSNFELLQEFSARVDCPQKINIILDDLESKGISTISASVSSIFEDFSVGIPIESICLRYACLGNKVKNVKALFARKTKPETKDSFYWLQECCTHGWYDLAKVLLENKVPVNHTKLRKSPLSLAVDFCRFELANLLIEYGADVDQQNDIGETLLHNLCSGEMFHGSQRDRFMLIQLLVESGADLDIKNIQGHKACDVSNNYFITEYFDARNIR